MSDRGSRLDLLNDPEFCAMAAAKDRICTVLTIITLVVYFGFIFLVAFNKEFFGKKITTNIPLGIPVGVGVIVASFILTGIYVRWANGKYDAMVRSIKSKVENGTPERPGPG